MDDKKSLTKQLWAKSGSHDVVPGTTFHYLWRHLLDAAAVCRALLPRFGRIGDIPDAWLCCLVALHDIGKADPLFQNKIDLTDSIFAGRFDLGAWAIAGLIGDIDPERDREDIARFRHEVRSELWLYRWLMQRPHPWGEDAVQVITAAVRGHHGDFNADEAPDETALPRRRAVWDPVRYELASMVTETIGVPDDYAPDNFDVVHASRVGMLLSGLIVLSDWIASNPELLNYRALAALPGADDPVVYYAAACTAAEEIVARMELNAGASIYGDSVPLRFAGVWPGERYHPPRSTQRVLEAAILEGNASPGLAIIEAPMGEGKTESAVYLAEEWSRQTDRTGVYIALPTQATSNQMHTRYRAYLSVRTPGQAGPRLVHGMAWLLDSEKHPAPNTVPETHGNPADRRDEERRAQEWFQSAKRALIAPEGVGTIDQSLLGALNVRHGFLRLFGLSAKILVVDEVHAYDAYMTAILCRLLTWCRALTIPVILLSATLSAVQKNALIGAWRGRTKGEVASPRSDADSAAYPLITFAPFDGSSTRTVPVKDYDRMAAINLKAIPVDLADPIAATEALAEMAGSLVTGDEGAGSVCVLVNTVARAQTVFQSLIHRRRNGQLKGVKLFLFHARYRAERRAQIELQVTSRFGRGKRTVANPKRPTRAIVVATQVVEQSLDVDFDAMVTEIAPIDLLLQRSGRLHRHAGRQRPACHRQPTLRIAIPISGSFDFGLTERVYARHILLRTLTLLPSGDNETICTFHSPADFRGWIEAVYGEPKPLTQDETLLAEIEQSRPDWLTQVAAESGAAKPHLLPEPKARQFVLDGHRNAVDEADEGDDRPRSYLRARTRLGDDSRAILCPSDSKTIRRLERALIHPDRWPDRTLLRELFRQKVTIPVRWLAGALPADGTPALLEGQTAPRWLQRHTVLLMPNGNWHGVDRGGRRFLIRDDIALGFLREAEKDEEDATTDAPA